MRTILMQLDVGLSDADARDAVVDYYAKAPEKPKIDGVAYDATTGRAQVTVK